MRRTLALVAAAVTSMVALAFLLPLGLMVSEFARDRALTDAERQAAALAPVLVVTTDRAALERAVATTQAGAAGRMVLHLPAASRAPSGQTIGSPRAGAGDLRTAAERGRSFAVPVRGGYALLQPVVLESGGTAVIEVFLPSADLSRGVPQALAVMAGVAVVLVIGSVFVADRLAAQVVRASRRLASATAAFGAGDLRVRIKPEGPPELAEAGDAFNRMADRVNRLLAAERELAADLSHRLRTPLAALRLNASVLGGGQVADQTRAAVDRLEQEVDLVIRTARGAGRAEQGCDAAEVLRERLAFWSALADDQGRAWEYVGPDAGAWVPLGRTELVACIDALVGNVFRHTGEGTAFAVTLHVGRGRTGLLVADAGPGIADPEAALERGSSGGGSTGLGLDIARRAAESCGGELRIDRSSLGGAQVQLWVRTGSDSGQARIRERGRGTGWFARNAR